MRNLPFRLREQRIKSWTTWRLLEKSQGEQRLPRLLINRVVTFLFIITSSCLTCEVSSRFGRRCQQTATVRCLDTWAGQTRRWAGSCSYLEEHVLPYIVCRCWAIIFCPLLCFYFFFFTFTDLSRTHFYTIPCQMNSVTPSPVTSYCACYLKW